MLNWVQSLKASPVPESASPENLLTDLQSGESSAKTLGGKLFESVHNVFSSPVMLDQKARQARGQHSDQLAEVVGDTITMLPGMKAPAAGLIRASILLDTSTDLTNGAGLFAKNFAEGIALHKVSALTFGEGKVASGINSYLGKGALADTARFASAGFGLGAVKSSFRQETWLDPETHSINLLHAGAEIGKHSVLGAALAIPGGFIGSGITKAGFSMHTSGMISEKSSLAIAGVGSGYFSGAAVGGVQAIGAGADWRTAIGIMNESGIAGALSGGLTIASLARFNPSMSEKLMPAKTESSTGPAHAISVGELRESSAGQRTASPGIIGDGKAPKSPSHADVPKLDKVTMDSMRFASEKADISEATLSARISRLGTHKESTLEMYVAGENTKLAAQMSPDFETFRTTGLQLTQVKARTYKVGDVELTLPEAYALQLEDVARMRLSLAAKKDDLTGLLIETQLKNHPLGNRAHPADLLPFIEALPDRSLVKKIVMRNDRNPEDAWIAKGYKPDFQAAATAGKNGTIAFYSQDRSSYLGQLLNHEWGHLLMWASRPEEASFERGANLEKEDLAKKKAYYISEYSKKDLDENWAEHTSGLLNPNPEVFLTVAHKAPIRSTIIGTALLKAQGNAPEQHVGINRAELEVRLNYLKTEILPKAQTDMAFHLTSVKGEKGVAAAELLSRYASEKEFHLLELAAKTESESLLREAAFNAAFKHITEREAVSVGYDRQQLQKNDASRRLFLLSVAEPFSLSKDKAMNYLSKTADSKSEWFVELFSISRLPEEHQLRTAIDLLERAPDGATQKLAWENAISVIDKDRTGRVHLALRAIERYPRLAEEAVTILAHEGRPETEPILRDFLEHYNSRVVEKAQEGLAKIKAASDFDKFAIAIHSQNEQERIAAATKLAQTRDLRAADVLIEALLKATSPHEQSSVLTALKTFTSPAILKFTVTKHMASNPDTIIPLRKAMQANIPYQPVAQ